jgi:hypothetical protein
MQITKSTLKPFPVWRSVRDELSSTKIRIGCNRFDFGESFILRPSAQIYHSSHSLSKGAYIETHWVSPIRSAASVDSDLCMDTEMFLWHSSAWHPARP